MITPPNPWSKSLELLSPPSESRWVLPGICWFFTTRRGGVGQGGFRGFNLASHVGDDPAAVASNRGRLAALLKLEPDRLRIANQVHGVAVVVADHHRPWPDPPPDGDAIVTREPGLAAVVLTADCVPVLLADPKARVVAAIHAGWRGALNGVLDSGLDAMLQLGADRGGVRAIIGPCIRQGAYTVGDDVRDRFLDVDGKKNGIFFASNSPDAKSGKFQFDLAGYVHARLNANGITREWIHDLSLCTHDLDELFFSHRRTFTDTAGDHAGCGRQASGIFLR